MLHKPQAAWKHFSFSPKAGMYVKESVVAEKRLLPPQQQDAGKQRLGHGAAPVLFQLHQSASDQIH